MLYCNIFKDVFDDPEEEIIYNFLEAQTEALAKLKSTSFERTFDWRKILAEGKSRRRSMDIELTKLNRPKKMCKVDDAANDASRLASNTIQDLHGGTFPFYILDLRSS